MGKVYRTTHAGTFTFQLILNTMYHLNVHTGRAGLKNENKKQLLIRHGAEREVKFYHLFSLWKIIAIRIPLFKKKIIGEPWFLELTFET
jgi:hypothetical protein